MADEGRRASKSYDATLKHLVEAHPADWLAFLGLPVGQRIDAVDADLSSVTAAADKVLRVEGAKPYLAHLEFQSGGDATLDRRMLLYNVLLRSRHDLPVRSVVFLLHRRSLTSGVTGAVRDIEDPHCRMDFACRLVRVWEQSAESFLGGKLGTVALAGLTMETATENNLAQIYSRIAERLRNEASPEEAREIWAATFIMSGLRHDLAVVERLMKGAWDMGWEEHSVTYQAIIERGVERGRELGRIEEAKMAVLLVGRERFGEPDPAAAAALNSIDDPIRLEAMLKRVVKALNWNELLEK